MQAHDAVLMERHGPVALVALNRPDRLNAFDRTLREDLTQVLAAVEADEAVRVVVLAGEGRAFSAGADLTEAAMGPEVERLLNDGFKPSLDAIAGSAKPYVAAIQGACAGIGAAYAMACDLAVMEEDAYVYQAFAAIGLIPDGGNHWHMVQALGYKRAYAAIVGAEKLPAADCAAAGLVNRVVPTGKARRAALDWAAGLAQGAPRTLRHAKTVLRRAVAATLDETFAEEARLQADCATSEDAANAVAAFLAKRKPVFTGR
ncbi:MAG: enoyl-CoA hydratase-related protein [Pseudomonadota bacterium]